MIKKINSKKASYRKIIVIVFAVAVVFSSGFFFAQNVEAKKKAKSKVTKWQSMLERNGVDRAYWEKYLPKVSRAEYKKVKKALKKAGQVSSSSLGQKIRIGLFSLSQDDDASKKDRTVELKSVSSAYSVKDSNGTVLADVSANGSTGIKVDKDQDIFSLRGTDSNFVDVGSKVTVETSGNDGIIEIVSCDDKNSIQSRDKYDTDDNGNRFAVGCYDEYSEFRGKIELSFDNKGIPWVINELPLEQYTWGTGEIGDLDYEYYKLFSIIYRTYGYYNLKHKKKTHKDHNFDLSDTSSDQIYKGYRIELNYPNMKKATEDTR